ncbi:hypothetical protein ACMU_08745 [Actibacterium mucosum KCTC 23349]|uniref:Lipoprotein n=1 Tax=Actibacterium mucosum KCTC 23349 TaxID=1454373 RepID=A0A037ZM02_9RHOB|nr:hypothetical protein [Actibacterium mucosum]KAJ55851.1 hypothetical protein ACMU_08745 [Actibacterium mucosum KCTC 23349]
MKTPVLALLTACLVLTGCARIGQSRLNPFNWFGRSTSEEVEVVTPTTIRGPLVAQVTSMTVDKAPGGAIVQAVAVPPEQGYWRAELVIADDIDVETGTLVLYFTAFPSPLKEPAGSEFSRELTAGLFLSDQTLAGVRTIAVRGASNQQTSRR